METASTASAPVLLGASGDERLDGAREGAEMAAVGGGEGEGTTEMTAEAKAEAVEAEAAEAEAVEAEAAEAAETAAAGAGAGAGAGATEMTAEAEAAATAATTAAAAAAAAATTKSPTPPPQDPSAPTILHQLFDRKVELLPNATVLKSGKTIHPNESAALALAAHLALPAPRLLSYKTLPTGTRLLHMTYLDGEVLEQAWPRMTRAQKKAVAVQLGQIVSAMRAARGTGVIGDCEGGAVREARMGGDVVTGPFADEEGWIEGFVMDLHGPTPGRVREALGAAARALPAHRVVFSHLDLHQGNIVVREGRVVGLLDWEEAGWFPEYWEYVRFLGHVPRNRDWLDYVDDIFGQRYDAELVVFQAVLRWRKD